MQRNSNRMSRAFVAFAVGATILLSADSVTRAAPIAFTIDPARSTVNLNPTAFSLYDSATIPTSRQIDANGNDSWSTSYSGSIVADVTADTIQFLSGSYAHANEEHSWAPGTDWSTYPGDLTSGSSYIKTPKPAAYGLVRDMRPLNPYGSPSVGVSDFSPCAIRNLTFGMSDATAKTLASNGTFEESGTAIDLISVDPNHQYDQNGPPLIYYSSGGNGPYGPVTQVETINYVSGMEDTVLGPGTLTSDGTTLTLTIPFKVTMRHVVVVVASTSVFEGTLVATAPVPEPTSVAAGSLAIGLGLLRRRSRITSNQH